MSPLPIFKIGIIIFLLSCLLFNQDHYYYSRYQSNMVSVVKGLLVIGKKSDTGRTPLKIFTAAWIFYGNVVSWLKHGTGRQDNPVPLYNCVALGKLLMFASLFFSHL